MGHFAFLMSTYFLIIKSHYVMTPFPLLCVCLFQKKKKKSHIVLWDEVRFLGNIIETHGTLSNWFFFLDKIGEDILYNNNNNKKSSSLNHQRCRTTGIIYNKMGIKFINTPTHPIKHNSMLNNS